MARRRDLAQKLRLMVVEWNNGTREGHGTMSWADGHSYVGEWKNDCWDGHGTLNYADKDDSDDEVVQYSGEWSKHYRHGIGKNSYRDKRVSRAIYSDGRRLAIHFILYIAAADEGGSDGDA